MTGSAHAARERLQGGELHKASDMMRRPVAQTALVGHLVKNPINWREMPLDIIGVLNNAISQSQTSWFGQQPPET